MKLRKNLSLIAGAIAVTLTASPYAVLAETTAPSTPTNHSSATQPSGTQNPDKGPWESLGLTNAQKTKIQQIRVSTHDQFMKILTPDQQAKWKAAHQGDKSQRMAHLSNLNLTDKQKSQVSELRKTQRSEIEAVLTPEQLTKLKQYRQSHPHGDTRSDNIQ